MRFRFLIALLGVFAITATAAPFAAQAQFSRSYEFLKAVKERDGTKATDLINGGSSTLVNTRDLTSGETALHIVVDRRDVPWVGFLIRKGANVNSRDKNGITPLLLATKNRNTDIAEILLRVGADVNMANNSGETPLIMAVHLRDLPMVRLLLKKNADPDQTDNIAGKSARDYASEGARLAPILAAIENAGKADKKEDVQIFGPNL